MQRFLAQSGLGVLSSIACLVALATTLILLGVIGLALVVSTHHAPALAPHFGALGRTLGYAFVTALAQVLLATIVALTCLREWPLGRVRLVLILGAYFIPSAFVYAAFKLLFLQYGLAAEAFRAIGVPSNWWFDGPGLPLRLVLASIWQFWPFAFLLIMARLLAVPTDEVRSISLATTTRGQALAIVALRHLVVVASALFVARFLFMASKFDLPYLFTHESGAQSYDLLTVELFTALQHLGVQIGYAAGPTLLLLLLSFSVAALVVAATALWRYAPNWPSERLSVLLRNGLGPALAALLAPGWVALGLFVLVPFLAIICAAFTADSALTDGWTPGDTASHFTFEHWPAAFRQFTSNDDSAWSGPFGRTIWLSGLVSLFATAFSVIAGIWLAAWRFLGFATQILSILAFGIPTTVWIFTLAWADGSMSALLPATICVSDTTGVPSLMQGEPCRQTLLWSLHFLFVAAIAVYMSMAFWSRTVSFEGFRLLRLHGVDVSKPHQILRAALLGQPRQTQNAFFAVFPVVFAVSWSDITFSRRLADQDTRLFVDRIAMALDASNETGTLYGQTAVAAFAAIGVAFVLTLFVRRGLH